ncbi:MAG: phosphatase PAP2 family protein [Treponema sp.]|jgi:membrane-associated phospholipid phosphatase|nr:phosphatase PAP2 family protein [Treponema sp.]
MKKNIICIFLFCFLFFGQYAEKYEFDDITPPPPPPIGLVFHNIGRNALNSVVYNYGLNLAAAGLETWAFIETGTDWKWRNIVYDNTHLSNIGRPGLYIGYIVPAIAPVMTYAIGRFTKNEKLQITGLALVQSLILTLSIQTPLKMITGRVLPGIVTELDHTRNSESDDFSGEFNWFNNNFVGGWPSGHTANAFAAAATISEIYKDNVLLKISVYAYAALIGFEVTLDVHWASEAIAGALIGYAVGKTVGESFSQILEKGNKRNNISLYFSPRELGITIQI